MSEKLTDEALRICRDAFDKDSAETRTVLKGRGQWLLAHIEAITEELRTQEWGANAVIESLTDVLRQAEAKSEERRVILAELADSQVYSGAKAILITQALSDDVAEHTEHRWVVDVKPFSADYWRVVTFATSPHSREVFCAIPGCGITADKEVK